MSPVSRWALFGLWLTAANLVLAQVSPQERRRIEQIGIADHKHMMEQMGLSSLRPGPSGNPSAPNAANADEANVQPYFLSNPLEFNNGTKVTRPEQWPARRAEILELFDREIYGRVPQNVPPVHWKVVAVKEEQDGGFPVKIKQIEGHVDNSSWTAVNVVIQLTLGTPAGAEKPVPVILEFGFPGWFDQPPQAGQGLSWKQQLLREGWGWAVLNPASIQADHGAGLREGIIGLVNKGQPRKPEDWGCLRAWAWGAGRALDYFQPDPEVDAARVGLEGLSRYGKAAAVAMAYDTRFAIAFIGSSGAGGVKLLHRVFGEQVENLASPAEYHWFAGSFLKYAGPLTQEDLPVDGHHLVALCAPRPVFISAGSSTLEGPWIDAKGMFLGGAMAGPVYEILGKKSMRTMLFPPQGTLLDGDIAFRQHEGGHTTGPNWPYFIQFAKRYFSR